MMLRNTLLFVLLGVTVGFGAAPVATLSSNGSFVLRGSAVNTEGVPSWPVMAGDVIGTSSSPVTLRFSDGSRVVIGENSNARVSQSDGRLSLNLTSGQMRVTPASSSGVVFLNNGSPVSASAGVSTSVSSVSNSASSVRTATKVVKAPPPPRSLSAK